MVALLGPEKIPRPEGGPPDKTYFPSGENAMEKALSLPNVDLSRFAEKSQIFIPSPPEAKYFPSGEKATGVVSPMKALGCVKVCIFRPWRISQRIKESKPPDRTYRPSAETATLFTTGALCVIFMDISALLTVTTGVAEQAKRKIEKHRYSIIR